MTLLITTDEALMRSAYETLSRLLPPRWALEYRSVTTGEDDAMFVVSDTSGTTQCLLIDARRTTTPAELQRRYGNTTADSQAPRQTLTLVIAPYLSPRSREVLEQFGVSYLDLTDNAWIYLDKPGLALRTEGAQRNPEPLSRPDRGIAGRAAGRIIRALADIAPPYSVTALAGIAAVSPGYCSRTLQALEREALIERDGRGTTLSVDWSAMLARRGQAVSLFDPRRMSSWIARTGAIAALGALSGVDPATYAITGSFAAARIRAIAAPVGLTVYAQQPDEIAQTLDLLPTTKGADVRLVVPGEADELKRSRIEDGLRWVAPSQLVLDSVGGPGRMPQEGEAVLEWMIENQGDWRLASIEEATP